MSGYNLCSGTWKSLHFVGLVSLVLGGRLETFLITRLRERREKMWVQPTYPTSYPKVYIPSAIKTQMNLVSFCFLADWAVLGITENSNN